MEVTTGLKHSGQKGRESGSATMRANQLRLFLSAFAGILIRTIRAVGLAGTAMARGAVRNGPRALPKFLLRRSGGDRTTR